MELHTTRWTADQPLLGTYLGDRDRLADLRASQEMGMNVVLAGEAELDPATAEGAFCREHGLRVMHHLTQHVYHGVKLCEPIAAEQTTIPLYFTRQAPAQESRVVQIDDEVIRYEEMTQGGLAGCRRGADGTTPAAHREGVILFWPEPAAAEIERVKGSPNLYGYYVLDDSPGDAVSALRGLYQAVQRVDPGGRHPVCAGFGDAGAIINVAPGVCDLMLIYWYPVSGGGVYSRTRTSQEVQHMLTAARARVPGLPFAGVYQAFDGSELGTGQGAPNGEQLREELEDFVREGASGLVAFISTAARLPGWRDLAELGPVIRQAHEEIRQTGGLAVRPETAEMAALRLQPQGHWESPRPVPGVPPAWHVVGPFAGGGQGLAAALPPDQGVDLAAVYETQFGRSGWRVRPTTCGVVGLTSLYGDQRQVAGSLAYAACEVTSPREQAVQMRLCTDDDAIVTLGGREVYRFDGGRGLDYDTDVVPVTLPSGTSRLRIKIHNRVGMWGFQLRFTDTAGRPLEGVAFSPQAEER